MNKYKVFLRSGTVLTIIAEAVVVWNEWLTLHTGDSSKVEGSYVVIAQFAPGMWEGYQNLIVAEPRKADKSGS